MSKGKKQFLSDLADLCEKHKATFWYTNDDDGIHIALDRKEVFVGYMGDDLFGGDDVPGSLRKAAEE